MKALENRSFCVSFVEWALQSRSDKVCLVMHMSKAGLCRKWSSNSALFGFQRCWKLLLGIQTANCMKDTCTTKFGRFCPCHLVYCPQMSEERGKQGEWSVWSNVECNLSSLLSYCIVLWPTATPVLSFCEKRFYLYAHFVWAPSPKGKAAGHESDHSLHLVPLLRMYGAIPPHPHTSSWAARGQLYLYVHRACRS